VHAYLKRLVDERITLTELSTRMGNTAAAEDRELTDTERASVANWEARCAEIDPQIRDYNTQLESARAFADLTSKLETSRDQPASSGLESRRPAGMEQTSWGQRFVESEQFRSYTGRGQSGVFELEGFLETRAAITTTNLAIPHFIFTPVEAQATQTPLLDVCGRISVSSGVVDWVEIGADPVAAVVAEGAAKPEAAVTLTPKTAALDTLAHWVQITRQALEDAAYIRSLLESKLRRGLGAKAEADMATAIDASTTVQTATTSLAAGGSLLKSIRVGIGKVEGAGYNPNAVALNPTDYAFLDIDVMGTTDSGPMRAATFWGLTPVAAPSIPAGKAYVGDFKTGATLFDRGVTNVFLTDSHASLFISNILVILAEARVKSVVTEGPAICECSTVA
jgi:HK97 family phage major capsid protein